MRPVLVQLAWFVFPKPRYRWQVRLYLSAAQKVASWVGWLDYRAQEWILELEDLR